MKKFFFYEKLNINKLKYYDIIQVCDILDLLKLKDEMKLNEEKLNIQEIIEIIY